MGILPEQRGSPDSEQEHDFVRCVLIKFLKNIKNDKSHSLITLVRLS